MRQERITNKSIFVSSTFRDMQAERDMLRDFVVPRVNEFASQYGRAVELIDLRWGIDTDSDSQAEKMLLKEEKALLEAKQNKKVLRTCLDEIERSRPLFLGIIGSRYGWIPPVTQMESALDEAVLNLDDLNMTPADLDMSVTALEIEYGVLRSKEPPVCLFYFRDSVDCSSIPEENRWVYKDENEKEITKLGELKQEIRARFNTDVKSYPADVNENGIVVDRSWADMVAADIIDKLREQWGDLPDTPPDWKESEQDRQEIFRESRTRFFAGREEAIKELTDYCLNDNPTPQLLMLQGAAGSGKSGLLCKVMEHMNHHPVLLLPFCCGISSRSSRADNMLRYFISLICKQLDMEDDSDSMTKFQDLKDRFIDLLYTACEKFRVVMIVDALDQLSDTDEARRMLWISSNLPGNFKMLCSIIDGPEVDVIQYLGGVVRPVPVISKDDEIAIIHSIAQRHRKQIGTAVVEHILSKKAPDGTQAAQNPLYLSLIAQDLVMIDRYELDIIQQYIDDDKMSHTEALSKFMTERIDETPGDPEGAYLAVLGRIETILEKDTPGGRDFVRGICGMIAVSRSGLRESDLDDAFAVMNIKYSSADFSWLRQMMRGHFAQGDVQQWDFSHQSLRRALRKNRQEELLYLGNGLSVHFRNLIMFEPFAQREGMHHLFMANKVDTIVELMSLPIVLNNDAMIRGLADIYTENENGAAFLLSLTASADGLLRDQRLNVSDTVRKYLKLLPENAHRFHIEMTLMLLKVLSEFGDYSTLLSKTYCQDDLAGLYTQTGQTFDAEKYYIQALETREQICLHYNTADDIKHLVVSYGKLGDHKMSFGLIEEAGELYKKALDVSEKVYAETGSMVSLREVAVSYSKMGNYMAGTGKLNEALEYHWKNFKAVEQIYEQTGTLGALRDLTIGCNKMGDHLTTLERIEEAGQFYQKSAKASEYMYNQTGSLENLYDLCASYIRMGDHLTDLGQIKDAGPYYIRSLEGSEQIYKQTGMISDLREVCILYERMADHLNELRQPEEAEEYIRKAIRTGEEIFAQTGLVSDLSVFSD